MKHSLFTLATLLSAFAGVTTVQAQTNDNTVMVVHLKGQGTQKIAVANVDSVTFAPAETVQGDVRLSFDEISKCYVRPHYTPTNDAQYYYANYMTEEEYAECASLEDVARGDSTWLAEMADGYGMSMKDMLESFCYQGEVEEVQAELLPGHKYVFWVHAVNDKGGLVGNVSMCHVTTKDYQIDPGKVALDVQRTANGFTVTSTPDDPARYYTTGIVPEDALEEGMSLTDFVQQNISSTLYDYLTGDGLDYYLETAASKGTQTTSYEGVNPTGYYVIAAYLDADVTISSELTSVYVPYSDAAKATLKQVGHATQPSVKHSTITRHLSCGKVLPTHVSK